MLGKVLSFKHVKYNVVTCRPLNNLKVSYVIFDLLVVLSSPAQCSFYT